jgi:hypothetical protein
MSAPTDKQWEYARSLCEQLKLPGTHPYRLIAWHRKCSLNQAWRRLTKFDLSQAIAAAQAELRRGAGQ